MTVDIEQQFARLNAAIHEAIHGKKPLNVSIETEQFSLNFMSNGDNWTYVVLFMQPGFSNRPWEARNTAVAMTMHLETRTHQAWIRAGMCTPDY